MMRVTTCAVKGCKSNKRGKSEVCYPGTGSCISFHSFPRIPAIRKKWLDVVPIQDLRAYHKVCSKHFKKSELIIRSNTIYLNACAVPSAELNLDHDDLSQNTNDNDYYMDTLDSDDPVPVNRMDSSSVVTPNSVTSIAPNPSDNGTESSAVVTPIRVTSLAPDPPDNETDSGAVVTPITVKRETSSSPNPPDNGNDSGAVVTPIRVKRETSSALNPPDNGIDSSGVVTPKSVTSVSQNDNSAVVTHVIKDMGDNVKVIKLLDDRYSLVIQEVPIEF